MLGTAITSNPMNVVVFSIEDAMDCMNHVPDLTRVKILAIDEKNERARRIHSIHAAREFYGQGIKEPAGTCMCGVETHTGICQLQHFMSYTGNGEQGFDAAELKRISDLIIKDQQAAKDKAAKLRTALVGLVGAHSKEELEHMEGMTRQLLAQGETPHKDAAAAIDAYHALMETIE